MRQTKHDPSLELSHNSRSRLSQCLTVSAKILRLQVLSKVVSPSSGWNTTLSQQLIVAHRAKTLPNHCYSVPNHPITLQEKRKKRSTVTENIFTSYKRVTLHHMSAFFAAFFLFHTLVVFRPPISHGETTFRPFLVEHRLRFCGAAKQN